MQTYQDKLLAQCSTLTDDEMLLFDTTNLRLQLAHNWTKLASTIILFSLSPLQIVLPGRSHNSRVTPLWIYTVAEKVFLRNWGIFQSSFFELDSSTSD